MTVTELTSRIASMRSSLLAFTNRFTYDREESLDLVQDTILKALTYRHKFKSDTNLKGWLFTIMRNTFINKYRRQKLIPTQYDTTDSLYYLNIEDAHTFSSPEKNLHYKTLWELIEQVREEWRIPFKMYSSGYKYHEIAEHLKLPVGTVKNRIFHARKEIQQHLTRF